MCEHNTSTLAAALPSFSHAPVWYLVVFYNLLYHHKGTNTFLRRALYNDQPNQNRLEVCGSLQRHGKEVKPPTFYTKRILNFRRKATQKVVSLHPPPPKKKKSEASSFVLHQNTLIVREQTWKQKTNHFSTDQYSTNIPMTHPIKAFASSSSCSKYCRECSACVPVQQWLVDTAWHLVMFSIFRRGFEGTTEQFLLSTQLRIQQGSRIKNTNKIQWYHAEPTTETTKPKTNETNTGCWFLQSFQKYFPSTGIALPKRGWNNKHPPYLSCPSPIATYPRPVAASLWLASLKSVSAESANEMVHQKGCTLCWKRAFVVHMYLFCVVFVELSWFCFVFCFPRKLFLVFVVLCCFFSRWGLIVLFDDCLVCSWWLLCFL